MFSGREMRGPEKNQLIFKLQTGYNFFCNAGCAKEFSTLVKINELISRLINVSLWTLLHVSMWASAIKISDTNNESISDIIWSQSRMSSKPFVLEIYLCLLSTDRTSDTAFSYYCLLISSFSYSLLKIKLWR